MFDDSQRGIITQKFFEMIIREPDNYEIVLSPVLQEEISRTPDPEKKKNILERLQSLPVIDVKKNEEAENLAWTYVIEDVLTDNHLDDLRHVAYAVVTHCSYVVSWNMRHLSNVRTIERVNNYNRINNLSLVIITPPTLFIGE
ncbi:hypothetical protein FACS189454_09600 [Planctomycetales bacterium]|nr:hypothetical protein FACS189454_09600 [Planctomycetales bacterium]